MWHNPGNNGETTVMAVARGPDDKLGGRSASEGTVMYTRYENAPGPPMEEYAMMIGHASYDLIFRDDRLYKWVGEQHREP